VAGRRIEVDANDVARWPQAPEVEIIVQKQWNQNLMRVAGIAVAGRSAFLTPAEPERSRSFVQTAPRREPGQPYHLENALEFLDAPGEWYLDTGTSEVFYRPRPGEDLATAVVVAPRLETLVMFRGSLSTPIKNIELHGFVFEHTTWLLPSREGFIGDQAGTGFLEPHQEDETLYYHVVRMPGAIHLEAADQIRLERNVLRHVGGTGIQLYSATHDNVLIGNVVTDVSGNGIVVDMQLEGNPWDPRAVCTRDVIRNNLVSKVGQDYYGSVGIHAGYTHGLRIEHNDVRDMPYTGISVGWGWSLKSTALRDNLIRFNRVSRVMKLLADGGGIYTLSRQPGTQIVENYVRHLVRAPSAGSFPIAAIYLDQGSDFITVRDNVLHDVPARFHVNRTSAPPAGRNNRLLRNETTSAAVIDRAGLEPAYRDIARELD
jgi:hypothetical protein